MSKSSSNIVRFEIKNNNKDIQGGEKKVMKKSLSVILTTAMALSMFSSVAFGKTSADFTDLKDLDAATKAKFDALISAGIFDGTSETTFGLKEEMNRAQFAKVAALITGIEVNKDLKTSSFSDVKSDDAANGYALPYIEALKTAGITDGYGVGTYNPAGKVTKEQLATFLVRVLGKDADAKAKTGTDTTVTDWAQGYVALALELKLLPAGADSKFGGQANATRDLLLTGAYEAKAQYVAPGKIAVTSAKATGVQKVTVSFNKPVDTDKATLTLKKGSVEVAVNKKFADDKKSVELTLKDNAKIGAADYTVTLGGLDAASVGTAEAKFTGEAEVLKSIDFGTASDTIAQSEKARVKILAKNQYGENTSLSAGSFTAVTSGFDSSITKDNTGTLVITIDTAKLNGTNPTTLPGSTMIPVYVYENDSRISAQKTFKLGTAPFVSKVEFGTVKYGEGKTGLSASGDVATIPVTEFDQYGNPVAKDSKAVSNENVIVTPYAEKVKAEYDDFDHDNFGEVRVSLTGNVETSGDYTITIYAGSSSATAKVSVKSTKLATKIAFGEFTGTLAEGDTTKDQYIPIDAYDADGNKLSADDIVSEDNLKRINVSATGVALTKAGVDGNVEIVKSGEHKGQIYLNKVTGINGNSAYFTAYIATAGANSYVNKSIKIDRVRTPDAFKVDTEADKKGINGASDDFKILVVDQYGSTMDSVGTVNEGGNTVTYQVYVEATATKTKDASNVDQATFLKINGQTDNTVATDLTGEVGSKDQTYTSAQFAKFNKGFNFTATGTTGNGGKVEFKATLQKHLSSDAAGKWRDVSSISRDYTYLSNTADLTYSVNSITTLFAAKDSGIVPTDKKVAADSTVAKKIAVTAKDSSGNTVHLPNDRIVSVTSSSYDAAFADIVGTPGTATGWVLGNKAGTANVNVIYQTIKGDQKQTSVAITVKSDAVVVDKFTAGNSSKDFLLSATTPLTAAELIDLKVVDNYGIEYKTTKITSFYNLIGVSYVLEKVDKAAGKVGIVTVDYKTGVIAGAELGDILTLKAVSANGKSVTTFVTVK
ncbi:hypothetical protein GCM10008018_49700 [Paenibacillus marchantiophytorum]|uniref:SLH domain-containing protein n=1 Tax=Paenibacillus marchantiophytorum TaxID=1619310 RepID=A0ABQ1F390_9BACL|nr:S-layer homology domain-containing protein [Paenibacillus marchantiophytorum]GFZ97516.1 hypothetical protein GCM10008018_49700 [Paenibacillus marchantiophytorum]